MTHRFGLFDIAISGAAVLTVVLLAAVLQRAGLAQPFALAIAIPCSLLVLYPATRRWWRSELPFLKWAGVVLLITLAGLLVNLIVASL